MKVDKRCVAYLHIPVTRSQGLSVSVSRRNSFCFYATKVDLNNIIAFGKMIRCIQLHTSYSIQLFYSCISGNRHNRGGVTSVKSLLDSTVNSVNNYFFFSSTSTGNSLFIFSAEISVLNNNRPLSARQQCWAPATTAIININAQKPAHTNLSLKS